jgi:hypothetical protein
MKLVIDISAADKTQSAVNSITDTTPVSVLPQLVLGDTEPLDITFTDSSATPPAAPSWAGQSGYTLVVGLGVLDANAILNYTSTTSFVAKTNGWTGYLALTTYNLVQAVLMACANGGSAAVDLNPRSRNRLPRFAQLWLQVQVIDTNGNPKTYANLFVEVLNRTLPAAALTTPADLAPIYAWILANTLVNASAITALQGGSSNCLDGYDDSGLPTGCLIALTYNNVEQHWKLEASTQTTDITATPARVRAKNYATNNRVWFQTG